MTSSRRAPATVRNTPAATHCESARPSLGVSPSPHPCHETWQQVTDRGEIGRRPRVNGWHDTAKIWGALRHGLEDYDPEALAWAENYGDRLDSIWDECPRGPWQAVMAQHFLEDSVVVSSIGPIIVDLCEKPARNPRLIRDVREALQSGR